MRRTALAEGIAALATKPVLHGDNGSTLKATTVLAMLNWLGVKPSYSRPRVSDSWSSKKGHAGSKGIDGTTPHWGDASPENRTVVLGSSGTRRAQPQAVARQILQFESHPALVSNDRLAADIDDRVKRYIFVRHVIHQLLFGSRVLIRD